MWLCLPSGEHTKSNGKSPFLMGTSTISMAIFNSYVSSPEGSLNKHRIFQAILVMIFQQGQHQDYGKPQKDSKHPTRIVVNNCSVS